MEILLPTDFSDNATLAGDFAIDICRRANATLFVLHAYDMPYANRSMSTSLLEIMRDNAESNMKQYEEKLNGKDINTKTLVRLGNPIRTIKEMSKNLGIDLVVMGTKGASGLEELLLGSNASAVIQGTDVPVLIIPPKSTLNGFDKILLATDLNFKGKRRPLERLAELARLYNSEVEILHVQNSTAEQGSREFIDDILGDIPHNYFVTKSDDIEQAILSHCESRDVDLLATIPKQYGFFEGLFHTSLTSKLAYHTSVPMLALHEPKK